MTRSHLSIFLGIFSGCSPEWRLSYRLLVLIFPAFLSHSHIIAQAFQKLYTNPAGTFFIAHDLCSDGATGNFITGTVQGEDPQVFVLQTNPVGELLWSKTFTAQDPNFYLSTGNCIRKTSDNGLIMSAVKEQNTNETAGVLLKTTLDGTLIWAKYASCLWRNSEVCADAGNVYYSAQGKGIRKVFLGKISNAGQVLWEQWLEAGDMDFYNVESLVTCANGDVVLAMNVSKILGGTLIGPVQTILIRVDAGGAVVKTALFPIVHMTALVPLSDGRIAFRCSASDITWTGMGIMDAQFNWQWFKTAWFGSKPLLPYIIGQELAVSGDETRLSGIFYTVGGEKIVLSLDLNGQLVQEAAYFSGPFAQLATGMAETGYLRVSGITSSAFALTASQADGSAYDDCYFPPSCGIQLRDTIWNAQPVTWQSAPANCLQTEQAISTDLNVQLSDFCMDQGDTGAGFLMSDTVICAGETIDFQRNAGISLPAFGTSEWTFQGAVPLRASEGTVENVHFNQPGSFAVQHIFTVAGCRDTAFATVTVFTPPVVSLGADTTVCPGEPLLLSVDSLPGANYVWSNGDTGPATVVSSQGSYAVTVTPSGGCAATDVIQVTFLSAADISLGPDTLICPDVSIHLSVPANMAAYSLRWSTGDTGPEIDINAPGLYILQMDAGNCDFSDSIIVYAADCSECRVYAANVFAPENASVGNLFRLSPGCPVLTGFWRIYDRWGALLFESHDFSQGWDGRLNGKALPPGVYLYDAQMQLAPLQRPVEWRRVSGAVTLVK